MFSEFIEDDKELDVYESRILNKQYSDDTWKLTSYTSEIRNTDGSFFAFIDFNADGIGSVRECSHCLEYEIHNKLGPKILKKGETPAPDHDNWMQCHQCGNIYPFYQTYAESEIRDSLETTDNPFEVNESIFLATETRKEARRKGKKHKGRFSHKQEHEDPEIEAELSKGNIVTIIQET